MKKLLPLLCAITVLRAEERPALYPFDVTLGGTKAEMSADNRLFAEVAKPVPADAVLALEKEVPSLIVNAFPCGEDGSVEEDQPAAVIYARNVKEVKLDATMDKNKLKPGNYLASVIADDRTARIVFTVAAPGAEPAVDFSKVLEFLRMKAAGGE